MRIVLLNGGLGNQVFQYFFARFAERTCPEEKWFFDDSSFFISKAHNGYELEKVFGIKANLLSNYFDRDVWDEIIRQRREEKLSLASIFLNMGMPLVALAESPDVSFQGKILYTKANEFHPELTRLPYQNMYYHGYWINKNWFSSYREENLAELAFPELTGEHNREYADMIASCLSVGVHIRRGDFVTLGWSLPEAYYLESCKHILNQHPNACFFVFSDDIEWCMENAEALGLNLSPHTTYVSGNMGGRNYIDLQLLSMCKGMILSMSSFCYLAALMDRNLTFWVNPLAREI